MMDGDPDPFAAERLALERARLEGELELKRRELELKASEQVRSRWTSPLVVAAATAILGLFVNLLLTQQTARQQLAVEREKRLGELLVKAISTDDKKAAGTNLAFLIKIGLLPDEDGRIRTALDNPEEVPVLPSDTGRPVRELPTADPRRAWVASVGRLEIDGEGVCTAVLVRPGLALTASYCLRSRGGLEGKSVTLTLNYLNAGDSAPRYEIAAEPVEFVNGLAPPDSWNPGGLDGGLDYVLLRVLEENSGFSWSPLATAQPQIGEPLTLIGHLAGDPALIVDAPSCRVTIVNANRFGHGCASGGGLAGGPIFARNGRVIGIEFAGSSGGSREGTNIAIRADRILSASAALRGVAPVSTNTGAPRR